MPSRQCVSAVDISRPRAEFVAAAYDRFVLGRAVLLLAGLFLMAGCTSTVPVPVTASRVPTPRTQASTVESLADAQPPVGDFDAFARDDPQLAISLVDGASIIGQGLGAYFVEVTDTAGVPIVNLPVDLRGGHAVVRLPAGSEVVTAYVRRCGPGACSQFIGPRVDVCSSLADLLEGHRYSIVVSQHYRHCELRQAN